MSLKTLNEYGIEVHYKGRWVKITKEFRTPDKALSWGKWNFWKDKEMVNWRIIFI